MGVAAVMLVRPCMFVCGCMCVLSMCAACVCGLASVWFTLCVLVTVLCVCVRLCMWMWPCVWFQWLGSMCCVVFVPLYSSCCLCGRGVCWIVFCVCSPFLDSVLLFYRILLGFVTIDPESLYWIGIKETRCCCLDDVEFGRDWDSFWTYRINIIIIIKK